MTPEERRAYNRRYYSANREHLRARARERQRARRAADPQGERAYFRAYYEANRERFQAYGLKRRYGITIERYERMLADQGHACAVCRTPFCDAKPHVDHCHATGVVRGVLCDRCNHALGHARDDAEVLRALADYLEMGRP